MAVEAVANVVIQKLTYMLNEEFKIGPKLIIDEEIKKDLEGMRRYIIDAENKQDEQYLQNVYSVEDTIETFAFRIARQRKRHGFLMKHVLFRKCFTAWNELTPEMKKILMESNQLKPKMPNGIKNPSSVNSTRSLHNGNHDVRGKGVADNGLKRHALKNWKQYASEITQAHIPSSTRHEIPMRSMSDESLIRERLGKTTLITGRSYDEDGLELVGFKEELSKLIYLLTEEVHVACQIISIFGEKGSGKTTLAQAVLATKSTKDSFKSCCARVKIPKDSKSEEILRKLLKKVGDSTDKGAPTDKLKIRLAERLKEKKYLIVLDDVPDPAMWETLKGTFPDNKNGSKIIITTCHEKLAKSADETVELKRLSDLDSWHLFLRKAAVKDVPPHLKEDILRICNGLPLNIVLLGSLLSTTKESYDQWDTIIGSQETSNILALSYNNLPSHLKLCTLYMVLFPKDYDISVRRLIRLWLAEGFVKQPNEGGIITEGLVKQPNEGEIFTVAQKYFDELFQRSLIQISKRRSDGNHRRKCHLIGVLHDYLSPKACDINLFHVTGEAAPSACARRLVEYVDSNNFPSNLSDLNKVRSYLSFNFQKKDIPATRVLTVFKSMISNGFSLLRTLDLEGVYKPSLPDNLGDFCNLRYLGLRWTFLDTLPSSVGNLTYLETLDIKHTYVKSLPNSVWKLKHLRHLNLNEMLLDVHDSSFPLLLTLSGLSIIDRGCVVKHGLKELSQLRELGITFNLSNSEVLIDWVSKLKHLQQLMLRSKDDEGRPSDLNLKSLLELIHLSNVDLLGKLPNLPVFPQKIKVLSLAVSQLNEDPMPTLGKLECLTVLRLLANSYLGKKIVCPKGGFKELRVLKLWMLRSLEEWVLEEEAMEKLKELNIRCCPKLKYIPRKLLDNEAFRELTLTAMPKIREDVESKPKHFSLIVEDYKITALPWKQGDDSFEGILPEETNRTRPNNIPQASESDPQTQVVTTLDHNRDIVYEAMIKTSTKMSLGRERRLKNTSRFCFR